MSTKKLLAVISRKIRENADILFGDLIPSLGMLIVVFGGLMLLGGMLTYLTALLIAAGFVIAISSLMLYARLVPPVSRD